MAQPRSRLPLYMGVTLAGGVGYYLYSAGGSPKVAEKQFEGDIASASAKIKSELPGRTKEAQKESEKWASEAGAKLGAAADRTKAEFSKAEGKLDQFSKDARSSAIKTIDEADRKVEDSAAKAKGWFKW